MGPLSANGWHLQDAFHFFTYEPLCKAFPKCLEFSKPNGDGKPTQSSNHYYRVYVARTEPLLYVLEKTKITYMVATIGSILHCYEPLLYVLEKTKITYMVTLSGLS